MMPTGWRRPVPVNGVGARKDEAMGIEPTVEELKASVERLRRYAQECIAIVDELFPEDQPKPQAPDQQRQYGKERG